MTMSSTSTTPHTTGESRSAVHPAVKLLAVLLVAGCLRPPLTSVGPVLDLLGADTGLGTAALGALGALPLLAFAVLSPLAHGTSSRFGAERVVLWAMVALAAGIAVRSLPGNAWLWAGTVGVGASIALGNVLVPSIVKRDHPGAISRVTGLYTSVMTGFAALASGVAVPIAAATGSGWRWSLAVWAVPALLAAGVWALRMRGTRSRTASAGTAAPAVATVRETSVWRSAVAWQVTFFLGLQSATFYLLVNWLPTIQTARGVPASTAGWHLFLFQAVGIVSGLAVTVIMGARADQRATGVLMSTPMVAAMAGMLWAPGWSPVWVVLAGISSGSTIVIALALIGLRTRTFAQTAKLSGMAQSVGYLLAAAGPLAAGRLAGGTGSWTLVIVLTAGLALAQACVALWAGRDRYTHPEPGNA
ncbi:MFS transporter [Sphaerimonospora thailandensis]|uniref:MFS transporter n=1 Tax=Sphaerimonospora thailandensis TaxID=795644 RepID=UPI001EF211E1|nr:MFS transporter [Sphaerimonospora thailandensis]